MSAIVIPSNLIVLTRDNAISNGFYPPTDDASHHQTLNFFSSDRISLGKGYRNI